MRKPERDQSVGPDLAFAAPPPHTLRPPGPAALRVFVILYRFLLILALPALLARLAWHVAIGRETATGLGQRLGLAQARRPRGRLLWLHAASNGELASTRPLVDDLLARHPGLHLLITTNTETGRALALGWGLPQVLVALAPLDGRGLLARFLGHWQPAALIVVENELWPNRLTICAARGIPVLLIGARLSERSARVWRRLPGLARTVLKAVTYVSAQDPASEVRFRALGLPPGRIGAPVDLKSAAVPAAPGNAGAALPFAPDFTLLAASTHPGEEEAVLDAYAVAARRIPRLRLILAPRHPRRRDAIEAAIARRGLPFATRSRCQPAEGDTAVYLADTMGEMALWYRAAGMTFVGGSLVPRGGHTPYEPAACGSAILHGPHLENFVPAYGALDRAGAAIAVTGAADLADALGTLAGDARAQSDLAGRARTALADLGQGAVLSSGPGTGPSTGPSTALSTGLADFHAALRAAAGL